MNRVDRLFGILTLLQSKKFVPAETIAAKFGISIRTVYRDVKALCEQGIPVSFEQGKGYFVAQGYFSSPVAFSSEEANALLDTLNKRCMKLMQELEPALHDIADELLKRETIPGSDVTRAIDAVSTDDMKAA